MSEQASSGGQGGRDQIVYVDNSNSGMFSIGGELSLPIRGGYATPLQWEEVVNPETSQSTQQYHTEIQKSSLIQRALNIGHAVIHPDALFSLIDRAVGGDEITEEKERMFFKALSDEHIVRMTMEVSTDFNHYIQRLVDLYKEDDNYYDSEGDLLDEVRDRCHDVIHCFNLATFHGETIHESFWPTKVVDLSYNCITREELLKDADFIASYKRSNSDALLNFYKTDYRGTKSVAKLEYILSLALDSRTDIKNWDLIRLFTEESNCEITMDKKAINRIFFDTRIPSDFINSDIKHNTKEPKKFDIKQIFGGDCDSAARAMQPAVNEKELLYQTALKEMIKRRDDYMSVASAFRLLSQKDTAEAESYIVKQLREIEETGLFEVLAYDRLTNDFHIRNTEPFIIKLNKEYQTEDTKEVYLGYFDIFLNLMTFKVLIRPTADNASTILYSRCGGAPFILNDSKHLCFGVETAKVDRLVKERNIFGLLKLLWEVMSSYESDSVPATKIDYFIAIQRHVRSYSELIAKLKENGKLKKDEKKQLGKINLEARRQYVHYDFVAQEFVCAHSGGWRPTPCCKKTVGNCTCVNGE